MVRIWKSARLFSCSLFLLFTLLCVSCPLGQAGGDDDLMNEVSALLSQRSEFNPIQKTALRDMLSFQWIKKKIHEQPKVPTVFFAVGNYSQTTRESWPLNQYENVVEQVKSFTEHGYRIAYDKDSPVLTQIIQTHVKHRMRLGISGENPTRQGEEPMSSTRTVVIQNPWLHLKALLGFQKVVVTPDSFVGVALVIKGVPVKTGPQLYTFSDFLTQLRRIGDWGQDLAEGRSTDRSQQKAFGETSIAEQPDSSASTPLFSWLASWFGSSEPVVEPSLKGNRKIVNLRIQYPTDRLPQPLTSASLDSDPDSTPQAFAPFHLETFAEKLAGKSDDKTLTEALTFSREYLDHLNQTNEGLKKGAAVFGSGDDAPLYRGLLESTVRVLVQEGGFPIATGGMGGYMAVANRVAKELGGESIGIPGIKKEDAPLEIEVFHQFHTRTIPVKGYEERIPFLLSRGGEYVVYAPGGPGTMQELATHLVQIAGQKGKSAPLVFLDRDYYWGLVSWLQELPFSETLRHRIFLIQDAEELRLKIQAKKALFLNGVHAWGTYL